VRLRVGDNDVGRIRRALTGDEDDRRKIAGEGEMRLTRRFGVETARAERPGRGLYGLLTVSEMPFAGDDQRGPVVAMAVCGDSSMCGDADLERVRLLFDELEEKRGVVDLLGRAEQADGMRIFIGSENKLFSLSGSSTIVSPYRDAQGRIVGVLGVIGPTRLNYARIIPMVDYTARVVSKVLAG